MLKKIDVTPLYDASRKGPPCATGQQKRGDHGKIMRRPAKNVADKGMPPEKKVNLEIRAKTVVGVQGCSEGGRSIRSGDGRTDRNDRERN